jgi:hypothetical protein
LSVIFLFIDGVGLGDHSDDNPFSLREYASFNRLTGSDFNIDSAERLSTHHVFKKVDANLDVEGLPQSGTGQTALFTGRNAAKVVGRHFGPYPHSLLKPLLKEDSILQDLKRKGLKPAFINAYPPVFFEFARKRNRWSCSTLMAKSAGIDLNSTDEVKQGKALTAEIIQETWRSKLNIDIPSITPRDAAVRLLDVASEKDLVLYEYYLTDKAGHTQDAHKADQVLRTLDSFISTILDMKSSSDLLVICSDHGNLEDLSTKSHTRNNVPLFAVGEGAELFYSVNDLTGVKPAMLKYFD